MKFEEFWSILKNELKTKKDFVTLFQDREFSAYLSNGYYITIVPKRGKSHHTIRPENMRYIWNIAKTLPQSERYHVIHYTKTRIASYAVTFLKHYLTDQKME